MIQLIKKVSGKGQEKNKDCCGVEIKEVQQEEENNDSCCGSTNSCCDNDNDEVCC
ncbi:hypothetical protein [Pseudalkalibacillus salsuginis]|uniref:hypothetical protein n=1 Tax=Pseudalkalibacillus salsuginis TaxID=2910972 RepID=UPI001F1DEF12|nr:hypothetical protein [Pseudalkalibacillus salsuginis]MCF6410348.1 hypothetical protein [Pseudalkalibacillus salsuginis]